MNLFISLLAGFIASTMGIALPGLINMTAAKISMRDGKERALSFVFGAIIIIFFQTLSAILFANYISQHYAILMLLRQIGFGIFVGLSIYFLLIAKKPKPKRDTIKLRSKTSRFFLGILLSALNFFPVPYYVYIVLSLSTAGYFDFQNGAIVLFISGVIFGSFLMFYYYINFFKSIETKTDFFFQNMNKIIGTITGIVAILTLINIVKYYY